MGGKGKGRGGEGKGGRGKGEGEKGVYNSPPLEDNSGPAPVWSRKVEGGYIIRLLPLLVPLSANL